MPFQKGNRANPGGRPKDKPWADALRIALCRDDRKALSAIADIVRDLAMAGDMQAINHIADRLDGKPAQESTVNITRSVVEMSDDELYRIAAGSSDDAAEPEGNPSKLN